MDRFEQAERRRQLRARAVEFLGGQCVICGYDSCVEGLDFHHTIEGEKDFNISAKMTSWKAIEGELRKCELVCARCHREIHAGYRPGYIWSPDTDRGMV
jgi:predicted HNH restriction endonuclease